MRIAIFGTVFPNRTPETEAQIFDVCKVAKQHSAELYLPYTFFYSLSEELQGKLNHMCLLFDMLPPVDMAVSVGGDGTFLRTASVVGNSGIPVLGINTGRLGFLADVNFNDLHKTFIDILAEKYIIEERTLLKMCTSKLSVPFCHNTCALNEVAILKQDTASMITVHAFINNDFLTSYQCDGLVVATPTGSTAYSLSIGGPLLVPTSPNFVLSPIAPHTLTSRPLVVEDSSVLRLKMESRNNSFLVSLDGQSQVFDVKTEIELKKADYKLKVMKRTGHPFYETLRDKLMWGIDVRKG